jgi:hypothetical protein
VQFRQRAKVKRFQPSDAQAAFRQVNAAASPRDIGGGDQWYPHREIQSHVEGSA